MSNTWNDCFVAVKENFSNASKILIWLALPLFQFWKDCHHLRKLGHLPKVNVVTKCLRHRNAAFWCLIVKKWAFFTLAKCRKKSIIYWQAATKTACPQRRHSATGPWKQNRSRTNYPGVGLSSLIAETRATRQSCFFNHLHKKVFSSAGNGIFLIHSVPGNGSDQFEW